jgi:hypothetical protein
MRPMAGLDRVPTLPTIVDLAMDQTSIIGGPVGRTAAGGFGSVTPIQAHGAGIPANLYGLRQQEILRQPVVPLGAGLFPSADYGIRHSANLIGLRSDLIKRLRRKPKPVPRPHTCF